MMMNLKQIRITLFVLFSVMPLDAFAQAVITVSPEAVAGLTCSILTPSTFFKTQSISSLAGVEGSIRGITEGSNFALNLGIGYESRGFYGSGNFPGVGNVPRRYDVMRENYVDLDASFRYNWFQAGLVVGFPLNWHLTINNAFSGTMEWNYGNADMMTTMGIFFTGKFTFAEWTSGKLIFIARLDFDDIIQPLTNNGVRLTYDDELDGNLYIPDRAPIFIARIGLSYEFTVWSGAR